MMGKAIASGSFRATVGYVLRQEGAVRVAGNMAGETIDDLVEEFAISTALNPKLKRPCYHCPISFSPRDPALNPKQLDRIAQAYIAGMVVGDRVPQLLRQADKAEYHATVKEFLNQGELYDYQWFAAEHHHQNQRHIHLVWSRINLETGRAVETWQDQIRSQLVLRQIEQAEGLEVVASSWEVGRKALTQPQIETWKKTGKPPITQVIQAAIDEVAQANIPFTQFQYELDKRGIRCELNERQGQPIGVTYQTDGVWLRGSDLGKNYSLPGLIRRGIYQPEQSTIADHKLQMATIDQMVQDHQQRVEQLARDALTIWELGKFHSSMQFGHYRLQLEDAQQPTLYKSNRIILQPTATGYQGQGISEKDTEALRHWQEKLQKRKTDQSAKQHHKRSIKQSEQSR